MSALTRPAAAAVADALRRPADALQAAAAASAPGIRIVHTGILRTRERRTAWRFNLLGIVNVSSVAELVSTGTLSYDPLTGELNAADADHLEAHRRQDASVRVGRREGPQARARVRHGERRLPGLAADGADRAGVPVLALRVAREDVHARPARRLQRRSSRSASQTPGEAARRIGDEHDFGPSTFLVECAFDQNAADALFIGPDGPRTREILRARRPQRAAGADPRG